MLTILVITALVGSFMATFENCLIWQGLKSVQMVEFNQELNVISGLCLEVTYELLDLLIKVLN